MGRRVRVGILLAVVLALVGVLGAGCRGATEVTLLIRTAADLPCASVASVSIVVAGTPEDAEARIGSSTLTAKTDQGTCDADGHTVGSLVVTPGDSAGAVVVAARLVGDEAAPCKPPDYKGCIVARRTFTFVSHASVTLPISLDISCVDVPCSVVTSCRSGSCVSSNADCSEDTGACTSPAEPDPSEPQSDGGLPDAFADARGDAIPDGAPIIDARADSDVTGGDAAGYGNLCPTPMGGIDCFARAQVCCFDAGVFMCQTGGCTGAVFDCVGRQHCAAGVYCCAEGAATVACDTTAGQACMQGGSYICTTDDDCPSDRPSCDGLYQSGTGGSVHKCQK